MVDQGQPDRGHWPQQLGDEQLRRHVAKTFVDGKKLSEGMLNRVEAAIRAYDPCLSCSTHAMVRMPVVIELMEPDGTVVDRIARRIGHRGHLPSINGRC